MKMSEVRKLSAEEIRLEIGRLRKLLYDLRAQSVTEAVEGTHKFSAAKKDVARLLTERRQRQLSRSAETAAAE